MCGVAFVGVGSHTDPHGRVVFSGRGRIYPARHRPMTRPRLCRPVPCLRGVPRWRGGRVADPPAVGWPVIGTVRHLCRPPSLEHAPSFVLALTVVDVIPLVCSGGFQTRWRWVGSVVSGSRATMPCARRWCGVIVVGSPHVPTVVSRATAPADRHHTCVYLRFM